MKKLFSNWKNSLKVKKEEKVRKWIEEVTPPSTPFRPSIEILISYIKNVFYEKSYAEYVGGTLTFQVSVAGELGQTHMIMCNFDDPDGTIEYRFWLALCYIKYKTTTSSHHKEAVNIVRNYPDKMLAAKLLLEI